MPEAAIDRTQRIERARHLFFDGRPVPSQWVPEPILRSWERSRESGLRASDKVLFNPVSRSERRLAEERNRRLIEYAAPELERLYSALSPASWLLACLDTRGIVVKAIGDPAGPCQQLANAFRTGIALNEHSTGTTAPGCALTEQAAVAINANEHFLDEAKVFSCAAVPLFGLQGELIGALDASCRFDGRPLAVLESLQITGRTIENRMLLDVARALQISLHYRSDLLGTPLEGVLAFSEEGRLLGSNQAARQLLGLAPEALPPDFPHLFDMPFSRAIDLLCRAHAAPVLLNAHAGIRLHARLAKPLATSIAQKPRSGAAGSPSQAPLPRQDLTAVYGDPALKRAITDARRAFARDIPVLLNGETGTGKEVMARELHETGPRSAGPFVAINCSSIPEGLIEAELFGYEDGAYTGARRGGASGRFEQAHGGTLFLDEIGDMRAELQGRLLRVLQERTLTRVGGSRLIPVDVSLICATHHDLRKLVAAKGFREDLYYRISGLRVVIPPLREREDLPELIDELLRRETVDHSLLRLSDAARELLLSYSWPGNIRQLGHVMRLAAALAGDSDSIEPHHMPEELRTASGAVAPCDTPSMLERAERGAIAAALRRHSGNVSAAARTLGIARATLYRKLHAYDIKVDASP